MLAGCTGAEAGSGPSAVVTVKRLSCLASSRASSCADGADLTSASRTRASLQDTELAYDDVRGAILDDADLSAADLAGAYFI